MKSILITFITFIVICGFLSGCAKKDIFAGEQTYRISEAQIDSLSNANVPVDILRGMEVVAREDNLYLTIDNKTYAFSISRLPPLPPRPCQCRLKGLYIDKDHSQISAISTVTNQTLVFEALGDNSLFFNGMESIPMNKFRLE